MEKSVESNLIEMDLLWLKKLISFQSVCLYGGPTSTPCEPLGIPG